MANHIGITVNYIDDLDQFYRNVLMFSTVRKFNLDIELSRLLFNMEESPEVFLLNRDGVELEVFISKRKQGLHAHIPRVHKC